MTVFFVVVLFSTLQICKFEGLRVISPLHVAVAISDGGQWSKIFGGLLFSVDAVDFERWHALSVSEAPDEDEKQWPKTSPSAVLSEDVELKDSAAPTSPSRSKDLEQIANPVPLSDPYRRLFDCTQRMYNKALGLPMQPRHSTDGEVRALLDGLVSDVLRDVVPDAMRFARWAQRCSPPPAAASTSPAAVVVLGPHVASALHLHPLLGDWDWSLVGFTSSSTATADRIVYPLSRDLLARLTQGTEMETDQRPAPRSEEKVKAAPAMQLKVLPREFLAEQVDRFVRVLLLLLLFVRLFVFHFRRFAGFSNSSKASGRAMVRRLMPCTRLWSSSFTVFSTAPWCS